MAGYDLQFWNRLVDKRYQFNIIYLVTMYWNTSKLLPGGVTMNYKDYQNARDAAWKILLDCGVDRLPVEITQVCRKLGVHVRLYEPTDGNDGVSLIHEGQPIILVSAKVPLARQRFTCAHELGHIILGHVGVYQLRNREPDATDNQIEQAANVFASRILAPACVLWGCGAFGEEEISRLCNISRQAAGFRAKRMQELNRRGKFLTSHLEREVYSRFTPYIAEIKNQRQVAVQEGL